MSGRAHVAIGLGSNVGVRRGHIEAALQALDADPSIRVLRRSAIIETDPVGPVRQGRFLNAAAVLVTTLCPRRLLERCRAVESDHGRDRATEQRWGPRTLDIDLLLYGSSVVNEPGLQIPHPRLHERGFVLGPLAEIAGEWLHPLRGVTIECLFRRFAASRDHSRTSSDTGPA